MSVKPIYKKTKWGKYRDTVAEWKAEAKETPKETRAKFMRYFKSGVNLGECCKLCGLSLGVGGEILMNNIERRLFLSDEVV